jgi:hypothetical protein
MLQCAKTLPKVSATGREAGVRIIGGSLKDMVVLDRLNGCVALYLVGLFRTGEYPF